MQIQFLDSKDGSKTFSADGVFYHSSYSPAKEAQRFLEASQFTINPSVIFLIEPGLNFFSESLKQKFPECKIICVRFFEESFPDEPSWDSVINFNKCKNLSQLLINQFGEEALLCSTALIWPVAQKLFMQQIQSFFAEYKTTLEYCKTLLVTRQFFEKKWLINSCNFINYAKNFIEPDIKTQLPVVICASGTQLKPCINTIKTSQDKIFIICLSSALSVLVKNGITPDLILTTDGGFWAGEHLKYLKKNPDITLAAPCEAFIPKKILQTNPIVALRYNDTSSFICSELLQQSGIPFLDALRNPTVSGTGLFLAKSITDKSIYFCGLDLGTNPGFVHTQPNEIEKNNELFDYRLNTKQTRIARSRFNSDSLKVYRDWFAALKKDEVQNIYRVIDQSKQDVLGNIQNISPEFFCDKLTGECSGKKNIAFTKAVLSNINTKKTIDYVINHLNTEKWCHQIFPADFISIRNCTTEQEKTALQKRLDKKIEMLVQKIRKLAYEQ